MMINHLALRRPAPTLHNSGGDPLLFCKAEFVINDHATLLRKLKGVKALKETEKNKAVNKYVWLNAQSTVLGNIVVHKKKMTMECNSEKRLKKWLTLVKAWSCISVLDITKKDVATAMAKNKVNSAPGPKSMDLPPEIEKELGFRAFKQAYHNWENIPIPALDDCTPLEAMKTKKGCGQLVDLLKQYENNNQRVGGLMKYFNIDDLRRRVGLPVD